MRNAENSSYKSLVLIALFGIAIWMGMWGVAATIPPEPPGLFPSEARMSLLGTIILGWICACLVFAVSLSVRGKGWTFQVLRFLAFLPAWSLALVPPIYLLCFAAFVAIAI
jgi:hypothetical protein